MYCEHVKALLLAIGEATGKEWYSSIYWADVYNKCYGVRVPAMVLTGCLAADPTFVPPEHKRSAGQPSKKQKD